MQPLRQFLDERREGVTSRALDGLPVHVDAGDVIGLAPGGHGVGVPASRLRRGEDRRRDRRVERVLPLIVVGERDEDAAVFAEVARWRASIQRASTSSTKSWRRGPTMRRRRWSRWTRWPAPDANAARRARDTSRRPGVTGANRAREGGPSAGRDCPAPRRRGAPRAAKAHGGVEGARGRVARDRVARRKRLDVEQREAFGGAYDAARSTSARPTPRRRQAGRTPMTWSSRASSLVGLRLTKPMVSSPASSPGSAATATKVGSTSAARAYSRRADSIPNQPGSAWRMRSAAGPCARSGPFTTKPDVPMGPPLEHVPAAVHSLAGGVALTSRRGAAR